jgi:outer membrane protein assembly factor BamB
LSTVKWLSGNANIEGSAGFTFGAPGTIYAATGDGPHDPASGEFGKAIVALDQKTLKLKDWFTPSGDVTFRTAPVFFNFKEKDYLAVADAQGRLYVLDAAAPGGVDHKTPLFVTPPIAAVAAGKGIHNALASWQDADGTRWILAPFAGALSAEAKTGGIAAFKMVEQAGKISLQQGWTSRDLTSPAAPIIVNGVVFALSTGENTAVAPEQRAARSTPAVLYALDGASGKEMWSSARTITGFSHSGGLASGASKVFVSTHDGNLYAFGYLLSREP